MSTLFLFNGLSHIAVGHFFLLTFHCLVGFLSLVFLSLYIRNIRLIIKHVSFVCCCCFVFTTTTFPYRAIIMIPLHLEHNSQILLLVNISPDVALHYKLIWSILSLVRIIGVRSSYSYSLASSIDLFSIKFFAMHIVLHILVYSSFCTRNVVSRRGYLCCLQQLLNFSSWFYKYHFDL